MIYIKSIFIDIYLESDVENNLTKKACLTMYSKFRCVMGNLVPRL